MPALDDAAVETVEDEIAFCTENIRHPGCSLAMAGRFYEDAAEAFRAWAILRLLLEADRGDFAAGLALSGYARRAWLRRCAAARFADHHLAFSRSGSMLDCIAGDHPALAAEVFGASPVAPRPGDEYEDDFWWQRLLGSLLVSAPLDESRRAAAALDVAARGTGARVALATALLERDRGRFAAAFEDLLAERDAERGGEVRRAGGDLGVAAGARVFIEGLAVLKLARHLGLPVASEYPMCPTLALLPFPAPAPEDPFARP